jgi:O-antigen/teichoic acid export membrane protein
VFQTLYNPGTVYFEKELEFHKEFVLSFSGAGSRFVVSIAYALVSPTVWALVAGAVVGNFVQMVVSYVIHDYRPWPRFDRDRAAELVDYGKWIFGSSAISFFYSEGDDIFVGRVLGSGSLGAYQVAYRLSNAPATEIAHTISRVSMPAYSKIQDDDGALREGFHRVLQLSALVSVPMGVGIGVVAPVFVPTFLGDGWGAMVAPMQVLAVFGVLRSVRTCASPLFRALGQPDYTAKIHAVRLAVMVVAIVPLTEAFGLAGTALAVLLTSAVGVPIATAWVIRLIDDDLRSLAGAVGVPVAGSLLMGACAVVVRRAVSDAVGAAASFVATVLAGAVVYGLFVLAMEWRYDVGIREFVGEFKGSL